MTKNDELLIHIKVKHNFSEFNSPASKIMDKHLIINDY